MAIFQSSDPSRIDMNSKLLLDAVGRVATYWAVIMALRAAAGSMDCVAITDRVKKVTLHADRDMASLTLLLRLEIEWDLHGDGDKIVTTRQVRLSEGEMFEPHDYMRQLLDFKPEDVLKFAAYL